MLPFAKMNGAGNSILVVDERGRPPSVTGEAARRIGEGRLSFDQLMAIGDAQAPGFDATIRIFNTDGSRAGACGNGTRCVAWAMLDGTARRDLRLDIEGTDVLCWREADLRFTVDMGAPRFDWRSIPLSHAVDPDAADLGAVLREFGLPRPSVLGMGNPHAVFFLPATETVDIERLGRRLEHDALFPDRANISFAAVEGPDRIALRVWERGAGATLACGSAACATLVAAARRGLAGRHATLALPGGDLVILWRDDDHVLMTGPVELEERGMLTLSAEATA